MIIGILGPGGCGGTFLDWSLHFLAGCSQTLVCDTPGHRSKVTKIFVQDLVQNPLTNSVAHRHQKTHPNDDSLPEVIKILSNSEHSLNTFYYVDSMRPGQTATNYNRIVKNYPDTKFITYHFCESHIDQIFCRQYENIRHMRHRFSQQIGQDLVWVESKELRELLSLYYPRCIKGQILNEHLDPADNLYIIDFDNVWSKLETEITDLFDFFNLAIDHARLEQWRVIYRQWVSINDNSFFDDLPVILDNIVSGHHYDRGQYPMTFARQTVLASRLLYDYNLALKFNEAEDLSGDAMQWHAILEPNIYHNLEDSRI